jgi:DNA-binding MarR family transcriptional regulator
MVEMKLEQVTAEIPLRQMVTFRLAHLHARINAQAARILNESAGISLSQWRILVMIEIYGKITPTEYARRTEIDKGLVSRTVKGMIKEGLLRSEPSVSDHRSHLINMTKKGYAAFEKARPHMRNRQAHLLDSMTSSERKALFSALEKMELAIDEMESQT